MISWQMCAIVLVGALAVSGGLILLLRPMLLRYAMARPNARSSHTQPTPQGGGVAIVAAALLLTWWPALAEPTLFHGSFASLATLSLAALLLAAVGALDDIQGLSPGVRLLGQFAAAFALVRALPTGYDLFPALPALVESIAIVIGLVWFINLVNFMDGIDWMTVVEVVPISGGLAALGFLGVIPPLATIASLALLGATLGFAPFNRPVARLFLGDVGALPIGLLLGWLLLLVADYDPVAALLFPLYYVADATITLGRRLSAGERVWQAHRTHFYQRAIDNGFSVTDVVLRILILNVALAGLAFASVFSADLWVRGLLLLAGIGLVGWRLVTFARDRQ